ncbi:MAG TPA: Gfo/Idh/MocA family oxidoreductase [Kiritimatiellia bacterium]|nr:Gfo/Idh/MocA family oxidoreductase [Kiritimatiellia bacterium]HPS06093.1 Gfo/Idh/MocA family oxidoreductase [Kiritimatiellia bacterium]
MNRRAFVQAAAAVGAVSALRVCGQGVPAEKKPLRVAVIGCGGQGTHVHIPAACRERLVALVDPDKRQIEGALKRVREVSPETDVAAIRPFADYRKLFDAMGKELDAVMIATPNHQHALPALLAMRCNIPVYVEKPLTHTIAEARRLTEEARRSGVATQMGNQGQSSEGSRLLCEYVAAGAIGQVREVYCWSNRANGFPSEYVRPPTLPVPEGLDWDAWIGPSPFREYHKDLHLHTWHSWRDFGNGSLGNMGCHIMNHAYWALKLGRPVAVEVEELHCEHPECWPVGTRIRWEFPARAGMAPVKVYWYDGLVKGTPYSQETVDQRWRHVVDSARNFPPIREVLKKKYDRELPDEGSLLVGDKGLMTIDKHGEGFRMIPEEAHRAFPRPAKTLPRVKGTHQEDFFRACRGGAPACSNFDHAGPLAEIALLGNLAIIAGVGRRIEWDGPAMRCTNLPELNRHVETTYREGWRI